MPYTGIKYNTILLCQREQSEVSQSIGSNMTCILDDARRIVYKYLTVTEFCLQIILQTNRDIDEAMILYRD